MASYLNSLWQGVSGGANQDQMEQPKDHELLTNNDEHQQQRGEVQDQGLMGSIFSKGAKMASQAVGASPIAKLELNVPPNQRHYYVNGDEISGSLSLEVPNEIHHHGIKVILRGVIVHDGTKIAGIKQAGARYDFIQLTRDLDGPGQLKQGTFDYKFQFKSVDLDVDSYIGITLDVKYGISAEMVYEGSMMSYTVKDTKIFEVRNSRQQKPIVVPQQPVEEQKEQASQQLEQVAKPAVIIADPRQRIDFCGFRDAEKPCQMEIYLHSINLQIDKDQISGHVHMKELSHEIQSRIKSVKLQLVQQEIQGSTKTSPPPMLGQGFVDQMNSGVQPYKLRVIRDFQIMDGCCEEGDTVDFRLPLRGESCKYLCPTVKNVQNKFSVKFYIRIGLFVKSRFRVSAPIQKQSNNDGASSEEENERLAINSDSEGFENIESYSDQQEVNTNFLEVNLWR